MVPRDPKSRFSDRVADYKKFRPAYPDGVLDFITSHIPIDKGSVIADIGAGTGISTALLMKMGCRVMAVEPNAEMRKAAEQSLSVNPLFLAVDGSAEATGLPDNSVDLVTVFQAFHWFDGEKTAAEFRRILKYPGPVLLVWNDRISDEKGFPEDYEQILRSLPEYGRIDHRNLDRAAISAFFNNTPVLHHVLSNTQILDKEGVTGRFFSSSYTPSKDSPDYEPSLRRLERIFDKHQVNGKIEFKYRTEMFLGKLETKK
ncbi:MAG: methyltransferase domain-containing protein [Spirochaetales bacterium]|nr:methyltransferase domain-containing protein [Spirochaetales bacterium]